MKKKLIWRKDISKFFDPFKYDKVLYPKKNIMELRWKDNFQSAQPVPDRAYIVNPEGLVPPRKPNMKLGPFEMVDDETAMDRKAKVDKKFAEDIRDFIYRIMKSEVPCLVIIDMETLYFVIDVGGLETKRIVNYIDGQGTLK